MNKIKGMPPEKCQEALLALRDSLELWGGKWKLLILLYLSIHRDSENYFMQIQRDIEGISAKMLSKELKELELNRLVKRTVYDSKPVKVAYSITAHGSSFIPVAEVLMQWGITHRRLIRSKMKV